MPEREYCEAWLRELKEAERRRYRAACRVTMLEAKLARIEPIEFDWLMGELEAAHDEARAAWTALLDLRLKLEAAPGWEGPAIPNPSKQG